MERWERERILGEWGVRDGTARAQAERRALERDLEGSPLRGRPLPQRLRAFHLDPATYVTSLGGPLPWMERLRLIHEETAAHEERLAAAWRELADEAGADAAWFGRRWRLVANAWNFRALKELIERHNRNFPAEARLPMDPRTGDFALIGGESYRKPELDAAWVLERFPPDLPRAAAAA